MNQRIINKALAPVLRKLRLLATRGVVRLIDPATLMQQLQVAAVGGELLADVEQWEQYGLTAHPKPGAEALILSLGGDRDHAVVINVADRRYRIKGLVEGEVALHDDLGNVVHLMRDKVRVNAVTLLEVTAPVTNITGDVNITGDTVFTGTVTANGKLIDETHTHDSVQAGSSNTGDVN